MNRRSLRHHAKRARRRYRVWSKRSRWRAAGGLLPALILVPALSLRTNFGNALGTATVLVPLFCGLILLTASVHRVGRKRHCKKCAYEQLWIPLAERDPEARCPECGALWNRPNATVRGQRKVHPGYLIGGMALIAMGVLYLPLSDTVLDGGVHRLLSTEGLVSRAASLRGLSTEEWQVLDRRALTPAQAERLARGILERREAGIKLDYREFDWFETMILANALPTELMDAYLRDMNKVTLDIPESVEVGERVRVRLHSEQYIKWLNVPVPMGGRNIERYVVFGGYTIGDDPVALMRGKELIRESSFAWRAYSDQRNPEIVVRATGPDPLIIRARLWFVALPRGTQPSLDWTDDGKPILPPQTAWSVINELEAIVRVGPR